MEARILGLWGQSWEGQLQGETWGLNLGEKAKETIEDWIPLLDEFQPEASTSLKLTATRALPEPPSPQPFSNACDCCIRQTKDCTRRFKQGIPTGACTPCWQAKFTWNLSRPTKQPREELRAPIQALEPPKAPFPGPSQGPTRRSSWVTSKAPVTPSKQAPSLGPGPLTSKKAKVSVSKSRPKTPSVTQKAKFGIDVRPTQTDSIKVHHPLAGPPP
ncbi:hypothetical protein PAXRUDRAFT_22309 [Paxillus rubicundulus Ve08.2h10]|uniref:Uncharacterized protein n=1 Tax=Paxillus rubicundulus Ve08.2h10 TaxID=930991 RepID=A0A0D0CNC0_9AGAM|nr:hypothetical protein PAXRUDRAFT_22309 [Paxillus rubicundulus Ve08.2h10]